MAEGQANPWGALANPPMQGVPGLPFGQNGPAPDEPGACVVHAAQNRQVSVIADLDPEHPAITVCISDRHNGTCMEAVIEGAPALRLARALNAGGLFVYNAELALMAREQGEG